MDQTLNLLFSFLFSLGKAEMITHLEPAVFAPKLATGEICCG